MPRTGERGVGGVVLGRHVALPILPAVILTGLDDAVKRVSTQTLVCSYVLDLLNEVLTHVATDEGVAVPAAGPRVTEAVGIDLGPHSLADERIVLRYVVALALVRRTVDVDAEHLAEQRLEALAALVGVVEVAACVSG